MNAKRIFFLIVVVLLAVTCLWQTAAAQEDESIPAPGGALTDLTWDGQLLWAVDAEALSLYGLDPADGRVARELSLPTQTPYGLGWDQAGGRLLLLGNEPRVLYAIDPATGRTVRETPIVDRQNIIGQGRLTALTHNRNGLWVMVEAGYCSVVCKLDQETGVLTEVFRAAGPQPRGIAWDGDFFWLLDGRKPALWRALGSGGLVGPELAPPAEAPAGMAYGAERLWLADNGTQRIYRVTPPTGQGALPLPDGVAAAGMAWDGQRLWLADRTGAKVLRIHPETGAIEASLAAPVDDLWGVAWKDEQLLVLGSNTKMLYWLSPTTGAVLNERQLQQDATVKQGSLTGMVWDGQLLRVSVVDGFNSSIYGYNIETGTIVERTLTAGPDPLGLAWDGQFLWNAQIREEPGTIHQLTQAGEATGLPLPPLGPSPTGLAYDGQGLWVSDPLLNVLYRLELPLVAETKAAAVQAMDQAGQHKYAVLIQGDSPAVYDEFWSDTYLIYELLRDEGFLPQNIFVLYYNGSDHATPNPRYQPPAAEAPITDYAATYANVALVLNGLANGDAANDIPQVTEQDFLFVWTFDHGGGSGGSSTLSLYGGSITDTDFAARLDAITTSRRVITMQQCRSGGFVDNLSNNATVVLTCGQPNENCHPADNVPGTENESYLATTYHHGEFNYYLTGALHWLTPTRAAVNADANANRSISMDEAAQWVISHESTSETPIFDDPGGIAADLHIASERPNETVDLFVADHRFHTPATVWPSPPYATRFPPDDGAVPSRRYTGEAFWESPDILVDANLDGTPDPNPEFGQTNYVYATIHNIGGLDATNVQAEFYWADPTVSTAWPASWTLIGSTALASIPAGSTVETPHSAGDHVAWNPPDPSVNAHYCLLVRLTAAGDPIGSPAQNLIPLDNNIAMRNVTVVDAYASFATIWKFFAVNPLPLPVDGLLTVSGVPDGWTLRLWVDDQEQPWQDAIPLLLPANGRATIAMEIVPSPDARPGDHAMVAVAASVQGETVGGYTLDIRVNARAMLPIVKRDSP